MAFKKKLLGMYVLRWFTTKKKLKKLLDLYNSLTMEIVVIYEFESNLNNFIFSFELKKWKKNSGYYIIVYTYRKRK